MHVVILPSHVGLTVYTPKKKEEIRYAVTKRHSFANIRTKNHTGTVSMGDCMNVNVQKQLSSKILSATGSKNAPKKLSLPNQRAMLPSIASEHAAITKSQKAFTKS